MQALPPPPLCILRHGISTGISVLCVFKFTNNFGTVPVPVVSVRLVYVRWVAVLGKNRCETACTMPC
jgi:hypothetical protein